jgi:ABC-type phosphate/phosphonate transport system substrate-binding protein
MMRPFKALMESQTGVTGQMVLARDADELRQKLEDEQVDFGVFHGFEYAWARPRHPKLRALVIAVNQHRHLKACLVVASESEVDGLAGLKGKTVAVPRFSREHCHLFLERHCRNQGACSQEFFADVCKPQDAEAALDQVADGTLDGAVVEQLALDAYRRNKPGWFPYLKIVQESEPFPATVVTYKEGTIDEATLRRFRDGLIRANQTRTGKSVLGMCRLSAFEEVPADYDHTLNNILKCYPPPEADSP